MTRALLTVLGFVLLAASSPQAHHSYADFLLDQTASVEGNIEELLFVNPHVILKVRDKDSNIYTATWHAALQLGRNNVNATTLKVGDHVIVSGNPSRDATARGLSKVSEVRRPADGWRWSSQSR